jgi:hypothetical protein
VKPRQPGYEEQSRFFKREGANSGRQVLEDERRWIAFLLIPHLGESYEAGYIAESLPSHPSGWEGSFFRLHVAFMEMLEDAN